MSPEKYTGRLAISCYPLAFTPLWFGARNSRIQQVLKLWWGRGTTPLRLSFGLETDRNFYALRGVLTNIESVGSKNLAFSFDSQLPVILFWTRLKPQDNAQSRPYEWPRCLDQTSKKSGNSGPHLMAYCWGSCSNLLLPLHKTSLHYATLPHLHVIHLSSVQHAFSCPHLQFFLSTAYWGLGH